MKKNKVRSLPLHTIKIILLSILMAFLFIIFIWILIIRVSNPFKVSIYNYESYLSRSVISKIKTEYSYHTFSEINEFTKAINNNKAVAGVGSDHQIAQLVIEGKVKKLNLNKVFDLPSELKDDEKNNDPNKRFLLKQRIYELYEPILRNHLDAYEEKIYELIKQINPKNEIKRYRNGNLITPYLYYENQDTNSGRILGFEADSKEGIDHFYQFLIPYLLQDKVIAYNKNPKYRPNIKNVEQIASNLQGKTKWLEIIQTLVQKHNYSYTNWTNSYLDNAMIGQFYATEENKENFINHNKVSEITEDNYKKIFDYFLEFVQKSTGYSIKDTRHNKLTTDGLELVNDIIEPKPSKPDISIMYNGDSLDSYYANDNFANLEDRKEIDIVRPKNNYLLLDAWMVSNNVNDQQTDKLMNFLKENAFTGYKWKEKEFEQAYFKTIYEQLIKDFPERKDEFLEALFKNKNADTPIDVEDNIESEKFKKIYDEFRDVFSENFGFNHAIDNFNAVNYTPPYFEMNKFIKKYYFRKEGFEEDKKANEIFEISNKNGVIHQIYQPINLKLRTAIIDYYYNKTKS